MGGALATLCAYELAVRAAPSQNGVLNASKCWQHHSCMGICMLILFPPETMTMQLLWELQSACLLRHACGQQLHLGFGHPAAQAQSYENVPAPAIAMYSFGQPRVGNMPFAKDFSEFVPASVVYGTQGIVPEPNLDMRPCI